MKIKNSKDKGITLIALVVTIIILLILAGVTIGIATNGTGLFDKAKEATEKYQNAQEDEQIQLAKYSNEIDTYVNNSREYLNVKSGTYIGTGVGGSSNPNTLTFEEVPQMIIIMPTDKVNGQLHSGVFIQGCKYSMPTPWRTTNTNFGVNDSFELTWSNGGKTVSWFFDGDTTYAVQLNVLNVTYKYLAIF